MKRCALILVILTLMGLVLTACGGAPQATPAEGSAGPAVTDGGLSVTDALGRSVTLDSPPQRVVIAGKSSLTIGEALYLFPEGRERLVGLTVGKQPVGDFLSLVDPEWEQKTKLAPDAGPEQIAPLQPDVVLMRSFLADSLGRALEELDIPVVYVDLETPEQYFRDVAVLGQLLGNPGRAAEIEDFYRSRLERIAAAVGGLGDGEKPRVLLVQHSQQGGGVALEVPSASWLQTSEVELAGGEPVWTEAAQAGGWTVVNFEQIAAWDPDQIYVISYDADAAQVVRDLEADAQWQALGAVQAGAIYGFPGDIFSWDQPEPRWILGVSWLASRIHPDLLPDLDPEQEAVDFFQQMYGLDEAAVQEHVLPRLTGDVG
jgi:iron complex transport system substrate-binding protein